MNKKGDKLRTPPRSFVRIQSTNVGENNTAYRITVPAALARVAGRERLFHVEAVEEGILLRVVEDVDPPWPEIARALKVLGQA